MAMDDRQKEDLVRIAEAARNWVLNPPRAALGTGPVTSSAGYLMPDPHPCDLAAWRERLHFIEALPAWPGQENAIFLTRHHIAILESCENAPAQGGDASAAGSTPEKP